MFRLLDETAKPKLAWTELLRMAFELGFIYCRPPWTEAGRPPSFLVLPLSLPPCVGSQVTSRPWASVSPSGKSVAWSRWSFSLGYFECSSVSRLCCWQKLRPGLVILLSPMTCYHSHFLPGAPGEPEMLGVERAGPCWHFRFSHLAWKYS